MADERDELIEKLRKENAELQRQLGERGTVSQSGSGSTATTGGIAAGAGGVAVGGDVHGNIYAGTPTRDAAEALATYRRMLMQEWRHLSLRGLDIGASDATGAPPRFDLTQVYVDLLTTTRLVTVKETEAQTGNQPELSEEPEIRLLSALEMLPRFLRWVLLGDPGSGKSTFLTYLALCLAAHGLEPNSGWLARLTGWSPQ